MNIQVTSSDSDVKDDQSTDSSETVNHELLTALVEDVSHLTLDQTEFGARLDLLEAELAELNTKVNDQQQKALNDGLRWDRHFNYLYATLFAFATSQLIQWWLN